MRTIRRTTAVVAFVAALMLMPIQPGLAKAEGWLPVVGLSEACAQVGCMYLRPPHTLPPCPIDGKPNYRCNFGCDGVDD